MVRGTEEPSPRPRSHSTEYEVRGDPPSEEGATQEKLRRCSPESGRTARPEGGDGAVRASAAEAEGVTGEGAVADPRSLVEFTRARMASPAERLKGAEVRALIDKVQLGVVRGEGHAEAGEKVTPSESRTSRV